MGVGADSGRWAKAIRCLSGAIEYQLQRITGDTWSGAWDGGDGLPAVMFSKPWSSCVVFLQVWMQPRDAKNCRWAIIRIPTDSYDSTACHDMHQGFWLPLISITQIVSCTEAFDTWQTVEQQKAPWGSRVNVQGIQDLRITIYTCSSDVKKKLIAFFRCSGKTRWRQL